MKMENMPLTIHLNGHIAIFARSFVVKAFQLHHHPVKRQGKEEIRDGREYGEREECARATLITKPFRYFVKQHRPYNVRCESAKESRLVGR